MAIAILIAILIAIVATLLILGPQSTDERMVESVLQKREFISSKHKWQNSETKGIYFCALCCKLMAGFWSKILQCKKCGILVHQYCKLTNLKKPDCKYIIAGKNRPAKTIHQWRQSIHSISSICSYCESVCTGFQAYMCLWCHRMKHSNCADEGECDLGSLKNLIISPNEISCEGVFFPGSIFRTLSKKNKEIKEKMSDDSEIEPEQDITFNLSARGKSPVVVLVNKKSGGQAGNEYLKNFYLLLNPLQVISILDEGLDRLKIFQNIKNLRIVVGGGDGTICSVLNYLTSGVVENWITNNPPVAVFPLGTGNDLSRALGWGTGQEDRDPKLYLQQLDQKGRTIKIDRWLLTISNPEHSQSEKVYTVYNYLGIGLDAQVCYDFHKVREKYPSLFISPFSNKLIYTQMGAYDFLIKNRSVLIKQFVSVEVDGKMIDLEGLENLVLLNIDHWAGGVSGLWKAKGDFKPSAMNDGVLEVLGVSDMLHLGQIQIGMELPFQISQGKAIIVRSIAQCTMSFQIDGQPFQLKSPFELKVQYKDKVNLFATCVASPDDRFRKIVTEALAGSVIDQEQYQYFMGRLDS